MTVNEAMLQKNAQREKALSDAARKTASAASLEYSASEEKPYVPFL